MVKKYLEFINESLEMLLESDVVYSDKFRKILTEIESPVAKKLLDIENKDLPVRSNYFDILTTNNNAITFLPDRRAQEILKDNKERFKFRGEGGWLTHNMKENGAIFGLLNFTPEGPEPYKPNSEDIGEVLRKVVSPTSGKTYGVVKWANGEEGVYNVERLIKADDTTDKLWSTGRQEIAVGRGVRALLNTTGEKFLDKDLEVFVNLYKSAIDKINDKFSNFERVTGDKISYWYSSQNYIRGGGQLNNSCMSNVSERFFDIYVKNPEKISMIIYKDPDTNKLLGRALLWLLDDGRLFMDRIYTVNESDVQLFRQYAKENGWYVKYHNSSTDSGKCITPTGGEEILKLFVTIKGGMYDRYPYLDTLKYWSPTKNMANKDGLICNESGAGVYTLESTDGNCEEGCETCGGEGRVDCYECGGGGEIDCNNCDGKGEIKCYECQGKGENECQKCDGSGESDCETCDGSGKYDDDGIEKECPDCEGSGKNKCDLCKGDGTIKCEECDGNGEITCGECDGRGENSCGECDGNGNVRCPDCG